MGYAFNFLLKGTPYLHVPARDRGAGTVPAPAVGWPRLKAARGKGDEKIKEMGQGRSYRCRHGRRRNNGGDASGLSLVMEGLIFLGYRF